MDVRSGFRSWLQLLKQRSAINSDVALGGGAIALLALLAFLLRLPRWQLLLAGGVLALWFISIALERMSGSLSSGDSPLSTDATEGQRLPEDRSLGELR